jgi:outer membrane receptor protein involved in Fe transport
MGADHTLQMIFFALVFAYSVFVNAEEIDNVDDSYEIYETVVVAHRPPSSAGSVTISREEIDRAHPVSTSEVLGLVPGVVIVQHGSEGKGHQLFLRGFDAAHGSDVEVLLNGVSLNEPSHVHGQGYLDLYGIIPEIVSEMRVSKGPFLPWQGNFANAGSIRLKLGVPSRLRPGLVRTEVSHRGRLRGVVVAAPTGSCDETFVATEALYDRGFGPGREARRAALVGQYKLDIGRKKSFTVLVSGQAARFETPGALRLSDVQNDKIGFHGAYGPDGAGLSDRILGRLGFEHNNGDTDFELFTYGMLRKFSLEENFTGWLLYENEGDRKRQQQNSKTVGAVVSLEHRLPTSFSSALLAGAGWRFDSIDQNEVQVTKGGSPWQTNRQTDAGIQHAYLYGGFRFSPWKWITIYPSVRLDLIFYDVHDRIEDNRADDTQLVPSPRLSMVFPVHAKITLFADYGRGFRTPEARTIVAPTKGTIEDESLSQYTGGGPTNAISDTLEVGIGVVPIKMINFKLVGFATWLSHEMVFDHVSNLNLELDGTRRLGMEVEATLKPSPWLAASAGLTWVDARFNQSGNPVPGAPTRLTTARIFVGKERGLHGGAQLLWMGERQLAHGASADGYVLLDVNTGWRFEHFEVAVIVDNALNYDIVEGAYHYASWFDKNETRSAIPRIHYVAGEPLTLRFMFTAYL